MPVKNIVQYNLKYFSIVMMVLTIKKYFFISQILLKNQLVISWLMSGNYPKTTKLVE